MAEISTEGNTDKAQIKSAAESQDSPKENEYVKLVSKKIRTVAKKLSVNIANIEKKVASGAVINEDEQKVLASKPILLKSLKEFEELKSQMLKIQNQEEKIQKRIKRRADSEAKTTEEKPQIVPLIQLLHVFNFFDNTKSKGGESRRVFLDHHEKKSIQEGKAPLVRSESDIDAIVRLADLIQRSSAGIDAASDHASKLLAQSEEEVFPGLTYKHLSLQITEVLESPVFNNLPQVPNENVVEVASLQESPQQVPANHHVAEVAVPNHSEPIVETEVPTEEGGEQQQQPAESPSEEEGNKEKRDQRHEYRGNRRGGRGGPRRDGGGYGNQEYRSPKEGGYIRRGSGGRGGGPRRDGNRPPTYRGVNKQTPQSPTQS